MARQRPLIDGRRWYPRTIFQLIMLFVIAVLFAVATVQAWGATGDTIGVVKSERDGVSYLRPLTALIAELTDAQSTAVRGGQVQATAVNGAINAVDSADRRYGAALSTRKRWSDTRKSINDVLTAKPAGVAAVEQYGDVVVLVRQLTRQIADTSELILDPEIDSSYLTDAALMQLPDVIISAGRASDLAALDAATGSADSAAQTKVAVARYDVSVAAETIGVDLAKSLDGTVSRTLGANITGQLDAFRSAVDSFVPSGTRLRGLEPTDAANLARTSALVRQTARPLAEAIFSELDGVLRSRADAAGLRRLRDAGITLLGLLLALVLMWRQIPAPRTDRDDEAEDLDLLDLNAQQRMPTPRGQRDTAPIDPHDLLAVEELLHSGRAIRTRRRERGNDAG